MLTLIKKFMIKVLNLKLVILSKYENIFAKDYTSNWSEDVFLLNKLKILRCRHMLLMSLMYEKLLELFTKKIARKK